MEITDYNIKGTTKCDCGHEFTLKDFQELNRIDLHGFYANQIKHYSPAVCPECKKELILLLKQKGQTYVVMDTATKKEEIKTESTNKIEEFICPTCKKVCKNQLGLNAHMRTHAN